MEDKGNPHPNGNGATDHGERQNPAFLKSWKEISTYLGLSVRTVQRWERTYGMPVRRPAGKDRAAVIAIAGELDHWMADRLTVISEVERLRTRNEQLEGRLRELETELAQKSTMQQAPVVLAVDDDAAKVYVITRLLGSAGYMVMQAHNGKEALQLAQQKPDVIIMDVNMPDYDGFEVCRQLKKNPETAGIPVLFLSATYAGLDGDTRARRAGGVQFLREPVEKSELLRSVEAAMGRTQ